MLWKNPSGKTVSVGVQPHMFERHSRGLAQIEDNWCWAACVEMVATFYGFSSAAQAEIVEDTFDGFQDDRPGTVAEVKQALKSMKNKPNSRFQVAQAKAIEINGQELTSNQLGQALERQLMQEIPLIVFIGSGSSTGHCVVLTEIIYTIGAKKYAAVRYYDPWSYTEGYGKAKMKLANWNIFDVQVQYVVGFRLAGTRAQK